MQGDLVALTRGRARLIGAALLAYGLLGIVLLAAAGYAAASAAPTITTLARSSEDARSALASMRDAFDGFRASLAEARESTVRAAASARSSAAAARQLESAMSVSVLGVRPLLPLAPGFERQGQDLDALADELDDLARAIGTNENDVRDVRVSITLLYERTSAISSDAVIDRVTPIALALGGWLLIQALAALGLGIALLRAART